MENDGDMGAPSRPDLHRMVFDSAIREAVAIVDGAGLVVGWNEALGRLTGCPAGHAVGRHASSFWPGWGDASASDGRRASIRDSWRIEGSPPLEVEVTVEPIDGGPEGPAGFALIVRAPGPAEGEVAGIPGSLEGFFDLMRLQMDRMPIACLIVGEDFRIASWNPAAERMFGFTESEAIGREPYGLLVPRSARRQVEEIERRLRSGDMSAHSLNENLTKDGRTILCRWTNTPLMDAEGRNLRILSMAEEVTERIEAEEALRASERQFRAMFEGSREAMLLADGQGQILEANPAAGEIFGVETGGLIGRGFGDFLGPELDFEADWSRFLETGELQGSRKLIRADRTAREVEYHALADMIPGRHLLVFRDVSEWRREERERLDSDRVTRSVLDSLTAQIAVLDEEGTILRVNRAWRDFAAENGAGTSASEGVNYLEICDRATGKDAEYAARIAKGIREVLAGVRDGFAMEYPCQMRLGLLWFRAQVVPFQGEGPPRVVVSHLNITDRRATEDALKHHANRLEILRAIDRSIVAARSPEDIAATILAKLAEQIPCRWGSVETYDLETGEVRRLAGHGVAPPSSRDSDDEPALAGSYFRGSIRIPLLQEGRPVGSLRIGADSSTPLREDQVELVREVADLFAIALRQALLHEEIGSAKERLETLSRRLIRAEEDERRRIARELHDEIGQSLTAVKIHIQTASQALDEPSRARPRLEEGVSIVERTLRQIRSISLDLRPSLLDDFGLVAALRSLLNTQARLGGFATHLRVVADEPEFRLEPELETACFRVAQESLTNVVRYAGARYVEVEIRRGSRTLELSILDDGTGFDPDAALDRATSGESFGLLGIRERVALLGGHVDFQSSIGQGSKVLARFPLSPDLNPSSESPR